jgi:hypothetical protein
MGRTWGSDPEILVPRGMTIANRVRKVRVHTGCLLMQAMKRTGDPGSDNRGAQEGSSSHWVHTNRVIFQ